MKREIETGTIEQLADVGACHAVMLQLRPHLKDADSFIRQVMRQREDGYRLSAAWSEGRVVGVIGYRLQENLLHGRFVFVDDLVVEEEFRRHGVGAKLLAVARAYARETGCRQFVLDTGLHMALAQRFYYRQGLLAHAIGFSESL
jgi:GNAT superfamily N-acetyltransferase